MRLLFFIPLVMLLTSAKASPLPVEASIAYLDELSIACGKAEPRLAPQYEARTLALFLEDPDKVSRVKALEEYSEALKWAREVLARTSSNELSEQCHDFLTLSNLSLKQADPSDNVFVPVK